MTNEEIAKILHEIKKQVTEKIESNNRTEKLVEAIPYKKLPISVPENGNEVALTLDDVFLIVKERIIDEYGNTNKFYEIYNKDMKQIAKTNSEHRLRVDRDIVEDHMQEQINAIELAGKLAAGAHPLDDKGRIETYFEMIERKLVTLNKKQEQEYQEKKEQDLGDDYLKKKEGEQLTPEVNEKALEIEKNEQAKEKLEQDLGEEIESVTLIKDEMFFKNNPDVDRSSDVYVAVTKDGKPLFVSQKDGKYQEVEGFENASNESGRTTIIRNDDNKMETKNTYGAIYSKRHPELRYTIERGQYKEDKLIQQRENKGAVLEDSDKYLSSELETENTNFTDRNLEENNTKNITRRSFDMESNNKDANYLGNSDNTGGISDKLQKINKHRTEHGDDDGITLESLAQSVELRADDAMKKIEENLKDKHSIVLTDDEKAKIKEDVTNKLENKDNENEDIVFCDEEVDKYCDNFEKEKKEKEAQEEEQEKTLENDALNRLRNRH